MKRMALMIAAALFIPDEVGAQAALVSSTRCIDPSAPGPWFRPLRAEERHCDRESRSDDPRWYALKNLAWGTTRWSFGGELRARFERVTPANAGLRAGVDDSYLQYRVLTHVDGRLAERWRVFAEAGYWNVDGREPGPNPIDVNRGDISQLFVEWQSVSGTRVRAGRQQVFYGSGRLIGFRGAPNTRQDFDGLRVEMPLQGGRLDLFHFRPVLIEPGAFNDREDSQERLAGLHWARPDVIPNVGLDLYAFRYERGQQRFQNATGSTHRQVLGARVYGRSGRLSFNNEATFQSGRVGTDDAEAWTIQSDTQWRHAPDATVAFGLKTLQASGDRRSGDGKIGTFDPIYAAPPYLMQSAFFLPANLDAIQLYSEWRINPILTAVLEVQRQWRRETADGYYAPPMILTRLDDRGTLLGSQFGLTLRYQPRRDLTLDAWASRLTVTGPLERAGARDTSFFASMATWNF